MFTHNDIWVAIDELAQIKGYSTSGLAKKAGLDPTALNRSKRQSPEGKPRWPSTESIAKILTVTESNMQEFILLIESNPVQPQLKTSTLPAITINAQLSGKDFDTMGVPRGGRWAMANVEGKVNINVSDDCYALSIGSKGLEPVYRQGTILIVTPDARTSPGDRVVVCDRSGAIHIMQLLPPSQNHVVMQPIAKPEPIKIRIEDITWIARILWASQ